MNPLPASWKAKMSLGLGIASLLGAGFLIIPPILAIAFGYMAMAECSRNPRTVGGRTMATFGVSMGMLCLVGWVMVGVWALSQSGTPLPPP